MVSKPDNQMQAAFVEQVSEEKLLDCMRCGFCLPACPTYIQSGYNEIHSPRGRIAIMKGIRDGIVEWDSSTEEAIDLCLGCRACEPACPAGVEYGHLLEQTRAAVQSAKSTSLKEQVSRKVAFDHLFKNQSTMVGATKLVRAYQASGLQKNVRKIGFMELFPPMLKEMEKAMPVVPKQTKRKPLVRVNKPTMNIAFFSGCLMDTMFRKTNDHTIQLLEMLGCNIVIPEAQVCCGALHGHSGELEKAKWNARRNIDAFDLSEIDFIVNNAGGCGAFLAEYGHLLAEDKEYAERAKVYDGKIIDVSSLLVKLGISEKLKAVSHLRNDLITYQDSCHLRNVNRVVNEPREILSSIPSARYIELPSAGLCCGSAGIYNLLNQEMSLRILDDKMRDVQQTNASIVITTNPGCLLQMRAGIHRAGMSDVVRAEHIVDYLIEVLI
ncbi:(Fe-S)-binding protein [Paenisporosarcina quisquiliarum]|uniref:Glycolate oxidase iron-sulfur subunit n=1 Tax=Paenisporosarcina quisquiliarum TaxID=365346 RepID=A0A9X3RDR2_9BACL|nr:(Fe-S)-binding protein [Paenisporosarcina quisquiliarum]MCZ8537374.1 (Fe-S)-binding protein [Paenisporosarcina quisquiliarum]